LTYAPRRSATAIATIASRIAYSHQALAVGRKAGLNQEPFIQRTRDYLAESEKP
jgi:hypothetical protein